MVDDDEATADAVAALIHLSLGCEVHVAYGGADAIDQASHIQPDTIVMDITMPFVNGLEAGEILTRLFGRRTPQLIALTALEGDRDLQAIEAAGFAAHMAKPLDVDRLLRLLAQPV